MNVEPLLCDELWMGNNHLFYLADQYSKFDEVQNHLQNKDIIIQAWTILIGIQVKIELFKYSLARRDF